MNSLLLRFKAILCLAVLSIAWCTPLNAQNKIDSLTDQMKHEMYKRLKNFSFGFYVDAYYNWTLDDHGDTANIVPFSSNCPFQNQIRLNVAALEIAYTSNVVRGKLAIQFGDAPNLLASPEAQFIKNLRQANFGFRIFRKLWLDFGYFLNPVGFESSWPVNNYLSTVSVGGYYEPGNILGAKLSWDYSEKFYGGLVFGNQYSLAYGKNTHMAFLLFVTYKPIKSLSLTYNNFMGNQALKDATIKNNILYNNLIIQYNPLDQLYFVGQLDYALQTNSRMPPNQDNTASMFSGLLMAKYVFLKKLSISGRYEFFNDYDGFLSGVYTYEGKMRGLLMQGYSLGLEYKPFNIGYMRLEFKHLYADQGNNVFCSRQSDDLQSLVFTTGIRF